MNETPNDYDGPTYHSDIQGLLEENCNRCHRPDGAGPIDFTFYDSAKAWASLIAREAEARRMPPWGAFETDECQPRFGWKDDVRLTEDEISMLKTWYEAGAPLGEAPAQQGLTGDYPSEELVDPDLVLEPQTPYTVTGTRDRFICNTIDPGFTEQMYINAAQVLPDNDEVVHHVIVYTDPQAASAELAGPDGNYECFGGPGFTDTEVLIAWAPGAQALQLDESMGVRVPAGSRLVVQMHYHPTKDEHEPDATKVQLKFNENRPDYILLTALIGNFGDMDSDGNGLQPGENDENGLEFRIPADATDHTETWRWTLPETLGGTPIPDLKIVYAGTHMHYVGTDMMFRIEHAEPENGEPADECILQTPQWDFQWQRGYMFDAPYHELPEFRPGDTLHAKCVYNNSMSNPFVVDALEEEGLDAPHDVYLGDETLDEMCLAVLGVAFENSGIF